MQHLYKLAVAIRNADQLISASLQANSLPKKGPNNAPVSKSVTPTDEEQGKHEAGVAFKDKIDFSQTPSIEYLD